MKKLLLLLLCCYAFCFSQSEKQSEKFIPSFTFEQNDLELSRLAQPNQYFDKIGRRAGLMGLESGQFEMWVWPWKPLRNFELQFILGTSTQPILAKDIVRTISVTPEVTTLTYTYESFTVKEHILVPRNEPGAILLLEVHTTQPLAIIPGYIPVMQPMWPAGIGGQYSYWNEEVNGYIISEGQKRAIIICGSPAGQQMAAPPAHMFADNPLQFKIEVKPGETDGKFIPIVIAGANPDTVSWKMNFDSVKATYTRLWKNAEQYYRENYNYYQNLRNSTMQITTPDKNINLAYEWGKVALDNLMVENPRLGYGMVAGFGLSGGGARPGFAWYFGGDAFINVLAMNSAGMFRQSRDALAFTQKWQRQENYPVRKLKRNDPPVDVGKMAHELSQSDGLCDWWNDYRYGYNHADTSPWYIVAMGDYVRTSGDIEFLKQSWKSVKLAYQWCLSKDSDGDGLMDLKGAGLGALEFGKLVGIYADVYTCGVFVQAVKEMNYMAELLDDKKTAKQADEQLKKAKPRLEKLFWLEDKGFYAYGATDKGEQVKEKTPWSGVAMMFGLLDEERTARSIEAFNSADLCTDWGVRTLSNKSELFEPTNYNYGAVWPFIGTFFNTAQFKHHFALSGYQILKANIAHVFDHALGVVPEVFSGELNEKLGEGYHHQGFSTTGYMLPLVRGLLGVTRDGVKKEIIVESNIPSHWSSVQLKNLQVGKEAGDILLSRKDNTIVLEEQPKTEKGVKIIFQPVSDGQETMKAVVDGANRTASLTEATDVIDLSSITTGSPGSTNTMLKFIAGYRKGKEYHLIVEGKSGAQSELRVLAPTSVSNVSGAVFESGVILINFDVSTGNTFIRKEIIITLK
ncbi:MAG: hypothetical protein EPO24_03960 [Bacteroidetes bacterium]|nr:MAG: hypothetical protein EPO24_03960 [Bacteroidota bacterium]